MVPDNKEFAKFLADKVIERYGCDICGEIEELYHNEKTGLSLCESCDMKNEDCCGDPGDCNECR